MVPDARGPLHPRPSWRADGLEPNPPADKRTLIRRAYFDLIGLPPTPGEVEAFLADTSPDAFARVVDRCWRRRITASAGAVTGWTWPATRTPRARSAAIAMIPRIPMPTSIATT